MFACIKVLLVAFCFLPTLLQAQVKKVWALGDGEKVFRDDLDHPGKKGNFAWDQHAIHLKGLYNEVLAFQVMVETGSDSATGIEVAVEAPVNLRSGKVIGGSTSKYGPNGTIEIFTEHYLHVKDSTPPNWYYGSPAAMQRPMTGWIPDALIPTDALPGKGGFPVTIGVSRNQGFWVDVYLPRDQKSYPSGLYKGTVVVNQNGKPVAQIPIEVTLLPHYLPDDNKVNVWLYTSGLQAYFPQLSQEQADAMVKFEAHRHRIDAVGGFDVNTQKFDAAAMARYKPYLDGTAYTPGRGYQGPGEGIGEKLFPVGMYASPVLGTTKEAVQEQSDKWVNWFQSNAPDTRYFWYITDEPLEDKHAWINERANWLKSNPGAGKALPVFTTTHYQKALDSAIDIFAAFDGVNLDDLPAARRNGGDHWFYNGNRPRIGSIILEAAAVDMRVDSWIMYKYGIKTWFIWEGTQWQHNMQGPKAHLQQNVFQNPLTFINQHMEYGNGDGIVFYPGHMPFYPEEDRGLNRLLPSIRLKNIRRGQQDAAIMFMAEQKAGRQKVLDLVNKVVPKALSEVSMKDAVQWSEKGDDYDKVREQLLKLL